MSNTERSQHDDEHLVRGLSLGGATALNMIDVIGIGPFITIPLIISAMGGPQAMLGWIFGALLSLCDGLCWAELGAAMPGSGGSYRYLNEIYGRQKWGRLLSFLFIWQLSFSAPLSIASGCIGFSQYASYLKPSLEHAWISHPRFMVGPVTVMSIATVIVVVFLLYRGVVQIEKISKFLWVGVMGTMAWIIFAGLTHFQPSRAFDFPPGAFTLSHNFFLGLGAAMLIATYDFWGYYNIAFLGGEVRDPERNIPRAMLYSIVIVGVLYVVMNISILGVMPWRELAQTAQSNTRYYIVATMMERLYGHWAGVLVALLIMWTAFASVFSLLLGYSRVPYAAARDGNYFKPFARIHPTQKFPTVSLLVLGGVAILCCFLRLADVIAALVVIRILLQFVVQILGLLYWRWSRPDAPRPFKMWIYPVPAVLALVGFIYVLFVRTNSWQQVRYAVVIVVIGLAIYLVRAWRRGEWPMPGRSAASDVAV
ncbi:amino acid/polyamine/organocation transporter, APC superfamily [Candidatus Koribacter versatilis Ellin345]|uniref:Amino acid/polyamine/organocation transporter, APC superfamily n=1 Tax=Koribacter versatilis (strain Ellin345) TaxID=204669 RepID=Q1ILB6_KORVE|nr:APC family permease [Candidatus Koribacter versatilis]ABF42334.1 amino acid/polyamine/organocation transporter, APC superfamily [Candidatus Koribacter versatilis Ellin345]